MSKKNRIEILVRGLCLREEQVLLCHSRGASNTYLPGGHVEFDERAVDALAREIDEELGLAARVGEFVGVVEHAFFQQGVRHCEINLVFAMYLPDIHPGRAPESREPAIEFQWAAIDALEAAELEPAPLRALVRHRAAGQGKSCAWASTYRPNNAG